MTATEPQADTEEAAFRQSIGERPDDQLRRLVYADWLEERSGKVECPHCYATGDMMATPWGGDGTCPACIGTGFVPDGRADLAAALRATVEKVPYPTTPGPHKVYWWYGTDDEDCTAVNKVPMAVWDALTGDVSDSWSSGLMKDYLTAADAIMDLCRAWVKVNREGA